MNRAHAINRSRFVASLSALALGFLAPLAARADDPPVVPGLAEPADGIEEPDGCSLWMPFRIAPHWSAVTVCCCGGPGLAVGFGDGAYPCVQTFDGCDVLIRDCAWSPQGLRAIYSDQRVETMPGGCWTGGALESRKAFVTYATGLRWIGEADPPHAIQCRADVRVRLKAQLDLDARNSDPTVGGVAAALAMARSAVRLSPHFPGLPDPKAVGNNAALSELPWTLSLGFEADGSGIGFTGGASWVIGANETRHWTEDDYLIASTVFCLGSRSVILCADLEVRTRAVVAFATEAHGHAEAELENLSIMTVSAEGETGCIDCGAFTTGPSLHQEGNQ